MSCKSHTYFSAPCLLIGRLLCVVTLAIPSWLGAQIDSSKITDSPVRKGGIESAIHYQSHDSMVLSLSTNQASLFDQAHLDMGQTQLDAYQIDIHLLSKVLHAVGRTDSTGTYTDKPELADGADRYTADSLIYNAQSQRGRVYGLKLSQDEAHIQLGAVLKENNGHFVGAAGKITTCTDDHPHFYLNAKQVKVMPDNKVLFGPANLIIAGIPTPIALPFGLAPIKKGQRNGLIFPSYGFNQFNKSYYLQNLGYYMGLGPYADIQATADAYLNGDLRLGLRSNLVRRYKYRGQLAIQASRFSNGLDISNPQFGRSTDFSIQGSFNADPKWLPGIGLNGNLNIVTGDFNKNNARDINSISNNQFQSSLNYSRTLFQNKANLSVSARHSQNTQTRDFTVELPTVNFGVSSLTPFASKTGSNKKWYQQLRLSYNANVGNQLKTKDSLIFGPQFRDALQDIRSGMKHRIPLSTNIKLFNGAVNLTPSANYQESWYQKRLIQSYDPLTKSINTRDSSGFFRLYNYDLSTSLQTNIYGTFSGLKWGNIRAIRHTIAPSVSFGYRPDTDLFAKGWRDRYLDSSNKWVEYNPFQQGIYGGVNSSSGGYMGFSIANNVQAKKAIGQDTNGIDNTEKINLIDQFNLNSGYNFLADSLKFDDLRLTFNTVLFKQVRIGASASYSPYAIRDGRMINEWNWNEQNQLLRFRNANLSLNTRLDPKMFKKLTGSAKENPSDFQNPVLGNPLTASSAEEAERAMIEREPWNYYDFNIPWSLNFTYLVSYNNEAISEQQRLGNHRLTLSGDLNITPEWKIAYNTGYDLKNQRMAGSQFSVVRSLHCWQLEFSWIPDGYRKSWTFTLRPKSALLQDLKLNKRESFYAPFAQ